MTMQNFSWWCSANIFCKLFLVSVLLQFSLGFTFNEDEYPDDAPAFYHLFEDVPWKIPQKMPRGYMFPVPRVGRRQIPKEKRQNMIPQPRIGRELEAGHELAEILYGIQNFMQDGKYQPSIESLTPRKESHGKTLLGDSGDVIAKFQTYLPQESGNSVLGNKDSTLSSKGIGDISQLSEEDLLISLQDFKRGRKIGFSFPPKEDNILSKERKYSGFDISEDDKRDGALPFSQADRDRILTALEDKKQIGGLIAYPRLGRHVWELHSSLLPLSRTASVVIQPEMADYDVLLNPDMGTIGFEEGLTDAFLTNQPMVKKSRKLKLIPRIGRKKRSLSDENNSKEKTEEREDDQDIPHSDSGRPIWNNLQELDDDYLYRMDKKNLRSKNAFIPRIGKKSSDGLGFFEDKRVSFTPRIGRASFIPRIGRNDPQFRLRSRGAFVPRIGRRAALIPRIGRSVDHLEENVEKK